jgi:hypothetical protein
VVAPFAANAALETLHAVVLVILWSKTAARRRLLLVNVHVAADVAICDFPLEVENLLNSAQTPLVGPREWT